MRSTMRPPRLLALSHASRLQARLPRCSRPLGLGAKRPVTVSFLFVMGRVSFCMVILSAAGRFEMPPVSLWASSAEMLFLF